MSTEKVFEQMSMIGGLKPTSNFRWLIKLDGRRVLRQLFIDTRYPPGAIMDLGLYEWRDVPEKIEE